MTQPAAVPAAASSAVVAPGPGESAAVAYQASEPRARRIDAQTGAVDSVPVPPDRHEPVVGAIRVPETAADRAAAISVLERAAQSARMHVPQMNGYSLSVSFLAGGIAAYTGPGELAETWLSGRGWRWTASLGGFSMARIGSGGQIADENPVDAIPMRVQMLRDAIFWAGARMSPASAAIRTAAVELNGKPATCVLVSRMDGAVATARLWEEEEYCADNSSGLLQIYSIAPGEYAIYDYGRKLEFHGRPIPDRIVVYVGGTTVLDARVDIAEAGTADPHLFNLTPEMFAGKPALVMVNGFRFSLNVPDESAGGRVRPVIVHASIDPAGNVLEEELSAAADPALAQPALDLVRKHNFGFAGVNQRDAYINVRFGALAR
jgi:hypothetical protein